MTSHVEVECSLCTHTPPLRFSIANYLRHLRLFHVHQPNFDIKCGIGGCCRSYTNIGTFQNHVYAVHDSSKDSSSVSLTNGNSAVITTVQNNDYDTEVDNDNILEDDVVMPDSQCTMPDSRKLLQKSSALFLLGLKEKYKLPQVVVQGIIDGVTSLSHHQAEIMKSQVFFNC